MAPIGIIPVAQICNLHVIRFFKVNLSTRKTKAHENAEAHPKKVCSDESGQRTPSRRVTIGSAGGGATIGGGHYRRKKHGKDLRTSVENAALCAVSAKVFFALSVSSAAHQMREW